MPVQCTKWKSLGEVFETRAESAQLLVSTGPHWNLDTDTVKRVDRAQAKITRCVHLLANEPSLGLYHVDDHIRRTVPRFCTMKKEVDVSREKVKAITYDVEYSTKTVKTLKGLENFRNIQNYGARAQELLEQLTESSQTVPAKKP